MAPPRRGGSVFLPPRKGGCRSPGGKGGIKSGCRGRGGVKTFFLTRHVRSTTVTRYCRIVRPKLPEGREKGLRCCQIRSADQVLVRDHRLSRQGAPNPGPFGTHEEKELVLLDRAAHGSAKLVPRVDRPFDAASVIRII